VMGGGGRYCTQNVCFDFIYSVYLKYFLFLTELTEM